MSPLRLGLGLSLLLNGLLLAGLLWRTVDRPVAAPRPVPSWDAHGTPVAAPPSPQPDYSARRLEAVRPAHAYAGAKGSAFAAWREGGRAAFVRLLGYEPRPFSGQVRVVARWDFPTYTREKRYLRTASGLWVPVYLCMPKGVTTPRPAVIALPGHDGPIERGAYWATGPYAWPDVAPYMHAYGRRLAEAGYVVLAVDVAGIGELGYLGYERLVQEGLLIGEPLKRLMLEEVHEATDYLLAMPEVDPRRVGIAGVSLGGELAMFAGLLDPRLAFVVSSGFLTSYRQTGGGEMASLYIPGVLKVADIPDLAAMVAPRPMLIQAARNDSHFRIEDVRQHMEKVRAAYAGAGAPGALAYAEHDGGHAMDVEPMLAWIKRVAPL